MNTDKLLLREALAPYVRRIMLELCSMLTSGDYAKFYARLICASLHAGQLYTCTFPRLASFIAVDTVLIIHVKQLLY